MGNGADAKRAAMGAVAQINELEQNFHKLLQGFQQGFGAVDEQFALLREAVNTLKALVPGGEGAFTKLIEANRTATEQANLDKDLGMLKELADNGRVVAATTVSPRSILVLKQTKADGSNHGYLEGKSVSFIGKMPKEHQQGLLEGQVGVSVDDGMGGKIEVLEIYDAVVKTDEEAGNSESQA